MRKELLQVRASILASKGRTIAYALMIFFASLTMTLGVFTVFNYQNDFEESFEMSNAEDAILAVSSSEAKAIAEDKIVNDRRVSDYEPQAAIVTKMNYDYAGTNSSVTSAFFDMEDQTEMGKTTLLESSEDMPNNPIWLSWIQKVGGGYDLGDEFKFTIGDKEFSYTIAGFYENSFLGYNVGLIGLGLEHDEIRHLQDELDQKNSGAILRMQFYDPENADAFITDVSEVLRELPSEEGYWLSRTKEAVLLSRTLTTIFGSAILLSLTAVICIISLVVIWFSITNSIRDEMTSIGSRKALGYTSLQLRNTYIIQFGGVALLASIIGSLVSYAVLPTIKRLYEAQTGWQWQRVFDLKSSVIAIAILFVMVILSTLFATRRIKHIEPVTALRGGMGDHNFKKNYVSLANRNGRLSVLLGFKSLLQNQKQNIMIFLISLVASFGAMFAIIMYDGIVIENESFINLVVGEYPEIRVSFNDSADQKKIIDELNADPQIEQVIVGDTLSLNVADQTMYAIITEDFEHFKTDMTYIGRYPIYDNEVALNGYLAEKLGKEVGDEISITNNENSASYLITGFIQSSNYLGREGLLTSGGLNRIYKGYKPVVYNIYTVDGVDVDEKLNEIESGYEEHLSDIFNEESNIDSAMNIYNVMVTLFAVIIVIVIAIVIMLVTYLIMRTIITQREKDFGILKAMGHTSHQITSQLIIGYLPVIAFGSFVGCIISSYIIVPMIQILFTTMGVMKVNFAVEIWMSVAISLTMSILSLVTMSLMVKYIQKITPVALLQNR